MNALLILLASVGQLNCAGGSCPPMRPSFVVPYEVVRVPAPQRNLDIPVMRRYAITHEGLDFTVEGWVIPGNGGGVTWETDRPFNAKAYAEAKRAKIAADRPLAATPAAPAKPATGEDAASRPWTVMYPKGDPRGKPAADVTEIGQVAGKAPKAPLNYGLSPENMFRGNVEKYTTPSDEAKQFVYEARTEREKSASKLHLTVIGSPAERKPVIDDLKGNPALADLRDSLLVQEYPEGHWAVAPDLGFPKGGKPSIVLQLPKGPHDKDGGRVVMRKLDYSMGAAGLAEAIRKADPSYDPNKDPGAPGSSGSGCPLGFRPKHVPWSILAAVAVVAFIVSKPKRS